MEGADEGVESAEDRRVASVMAIAMRSAVRRPGGILQPVGGRGGRGGPGKAPLVYPPSAPLLRPVEAGAAGAEAAAAAAAAAGPKVRRASGSGFQQEIKGTTGAARGGAGEEHDPVGAEGYSSPSEDAGRQFATAVDMVMQASGRRPQVMIGGRGRGRGRGAGL
jgi:hypothetical protein